VGRFSLLDPLRDRWLAALGFALALAALALGLLPQGGGAQSTVLALRRPVAAGEIVRRGDVVAVPIASADRTPSMVSRFDGLGGRRTRIDLAGGDFLVRGALGEGEGRGLLRSGERAVALDLAPGSAPDTRLLRRGRFVDVVIFDASGARVAARGLELLAPAREGSGGISVTLRAPAGVALALATGRRGRDVQLLLRGGAR
jgi:hypothetical protein